MPTTTTGPLTWPTHAELDALSDGSSAAMEPIEAVHGTLKGLVNLDVAPSIEDVRDAIERGAEPLSLEHVGALTSCLAKLRFDVEWLCRELEAMERIRDVMALEVEPFPKGGNDA